MVRKVNFSSLLLGNTRTVWLLKAGKVESGSAIPLIVLLDGEYYIERMKITDLLDGLSTKGALPAANYAFVSHIDNETRWRESFCNEKFASAIATELIPLLKDVLETEPTHYVIGGLSLTGLAAAHVALAGPIVYDGVVSQSGSFWWSNNWLPESIASFQPRATKFRMSCGSDEVEQAVNHGNGLFQWTSQLTANEMMRDSLLRGGYVVDFDIYPGGHELARWAADLPAALRSVLPD